MTKKRGFAAMSPEKRRAIASRGGTSAQRKGVGHRWNSDTASQAGSKGGDISARRRAERKAGATPANTRTDDDVEDDLRALREEAL